MKLAILAALAASVTNPDKFDLICTHSNGEDGVHLKIDLVAGEWCNSRVECNFVEKIVSATSGRIVLKQREGARPGSVVELEDVNRITGEYHWATNYPLVLSSTQSCKPAPFSGISQGRAKF